MTLLRLAKNIYFIYFLNTCFYNLNYLACKRGMKLISFGNETHFRKTIKVPYWRTIRFLMRGGGGSFANCTICFLPLSPCSIFSGVIAQHPNRSVPKMLSGPTTFHVMKEFGYICITRVVVVGFFYITERISSDNFRK